MTDDERDYKDWLQSREIDTALATIEAAQDEYDAMVHRLNDALAERDRLAARVRELEAAQAATRANHAETLVALEDSRARTRARGARARLNELTTTMRDSYFRYGHGYDDLMDEMMGSPETVLHWIDRIMAALFAHDPEQVTDILLSELADVALADSSGPAEQEA